MEFIMQIFPACTHFLAFTSRYYPLSRRFGPHSFYALPYFERLSATPYILAGKIKHFTPCCNLVRQTHESELNLPHLYGLLTQIQYFLLPYAVFYFY
jgi:hypothetical protein